MSATGRLLLLAVLIAATASAAHAAPASCAPEAFERSASALKAAQAALSSIPVKEMDTDVDLPLQAAIERVKDRIEDFVAGAMRCAPASGDLGAIQRLMASKVGEALDYRLRSLPGPTPMIGVVARFGIECGSDGLLMLFERKGGVWTEVMVGRSRPYRTIAEAWEEIAYDVSEPDAGGHWFLVTAHVNPWCVSVWQRLTFEVTRPGPSPLRPQVLLTRTATINIEDPVTIEAGRNLFTLRYDGRSLDPDVLTRRRIERYSVRADQVRRVDPVATNPRDFVDEWVVMPWDEASRWSSRTSEVSHAHAQLSRLSQRPNYMLTFESVRACKGGRHQIEIGARRFEPEGDRSTRFALVSGDGRYRLERVSAKPFPGCTGPDLKDDIKPFWSSP